MGKLRKAKVRKPRDVWAIRLSESERASLDAMATASGCTPTDLLRGAIPQGRWVDALATHARHKRITPMQALFALAAEGLRFRMIRYAKPVDAGYLDALTPDGMAREYVAFCDAVAYDVGVVGPLGSRHRFVAHGPAWRVVADGEVLTRAGHTVNITLEMMLTSLRDPDPETRVAAGCLLANSLGVGLRLAGETLEDVQNIIAPQICELLGRAMADGDPAAITEIERLITSNPSHAFRPATVAEPAGAHANTEDA